MGEENIETKLEKLRSMIATRKILAEKIIDMEQEIVEHDEISEVLSKTEPDRKTMRVIGTVVVERTASEILKAVQQDIVQMKKVLEGLNEQLKLKEQEINSFVSDNKLEQYVTTSIG